MWVNKVQIIAIAVSASLASAALLSSFLIEPVSSPAENTQEEQQQQAEEDLIPLTEVHGVISDIGKDGAVNPPSQAETTIPERNKVYVPLSWDVEDAVLCGRQGSTYLWGTCGECVVANTLNLALDTSYSEADIVSYVVSEGLCDSSTGGMTLNEMVDTYTHFLPPELDVFGFGGSYAPTLDEMANKLDTGKLLNVSIYGEMMREGGHTGEGEIYGTHWILLHGCHRDDSGHVVGFDVLDPASTIDYLSAEDLSNVYYGHDGTKILDPSCVQVFGWKYADWGVKS